MRLAGEPFSPDELRTVIRLLAGPGIVWKLEFGDFVLLRPEQINAYAAAMIRSVRAHTKSGDSYLRRLKDGREVFTIKNPRHTEYWQRQAYPVMLVVRTSDGVIRWMDVSAYLAERARTGEASVNQIVFAGEPFTAINLQRLRDQRVPPGS